jgi:transposase
MVERAEDVSDVLDYVPGYFKMLRHVHPKLSCPRCAVVCRSQHRRGRSNVLMAGAGLLAQIIVSEVR